MAKFVAILAVALIIIAGVFVFLQNREAVQMPDDMAEAKLLPEAEEAALVAQAIPSFDPAPGERVLQGGQYITYVYFTRKGFMPSEITVSQGEAVRFLNASSVAMHVGSRTNASGNLGDSKSLPAGGNFIITLPEKGVWLYENAAFEDQKLLGTVFVE